MHKFWEFIKLWFWMNVNDIQIGIEMKSTLVSTIKPSFKKISL